VDWNGEVWNGMSLRRKEALDHSRIALTVWNSLPSFVHTADSFTSFRSQLKTYVRKTFVAGPPSALLIPLPGLSRVINSLLTD